MPARTVLHGVDRSVATYAKLPTNYNENSIVEQEDYKNLWYNCGGKWVPAGGMVSAMYDFSTMGGAQGDIDLGIKLPAGFIVYRTLLNIITQPTSLGSATVALKLQSAGDLLTATAKASLTVGFYDGTQNGAAANAKLVTSLKTLYATIGTADLTAGKFYVHIFGFMGATT